MKKLYVIADWADDNFTCAEVKIALEGYLKNPQLLDVHFVSSTPSTIHTSFLINQLVEDIERFSQPQETVIFQNTDPRLHSKSSLNKAEGAKPLIIRLVSGIYLIGPNAGYDFSLIKNRIDQVFVYTGLNEEGQFHSRDLYTRISAHLMDYMEDELELEEVSKDEIPNLKGYFVGHIDNYGNIKTTITQEDFKGKFEYGDMVEIRIGKVRKKARFVTNLFGGTPGELVIYPGSSGKKDNRFLEVTIWRYFTEDNPTTGKDEFNNPRVGSEIFIQ